MKLALGTVQFGIPYGAFNSANQVPSGEVARILEAALQSGVDTLDTARAYGNAEDVLGQQAKGRFRIITKCPPLKHPNDLIRAFQTSAEVLGQPIEGYLLHNAQDLLGPQADAVWAALDGLRQSSKVARIGVSAYSYEEARRVTERFDISLVQLPANILDPWYETSALPETVEVHSRSTFLQGFLLSTAASLPNHLASWAGTLKRFQAQAAEAGLTPLQASLAPLISSPAINRVIVGVDSLSQFSDIQAALKTPFKTVDFGPFPDATPALTDPRNW